MVRKSVVVVLSLALALSSCHVFDDKLVMQRKPITNTNLKLNGYYWSDFGNSERKSVGIYFFYENGVVINWGAVNKNTIDDFEKSVKNNSPLHPYTKSKYCWGRFQVQSDAIKIERLYPSDPPIHSYTSYGEVLNDSTFVILKRHRSKKSPDSGKTKNNVYHFKALDPKPDISMNLLDK